MVGALTFRALGGTIGAVPSEHPKEAGETVQAGAEVEPEKWKKAIEEAVKLAAENPDQFLHEAKIQARLLGVSVERFYARVYEEVRKDPKLASKVFTNSVIQGAGKRLRKLLGI